MAEKKKNIRSGMALVGAYKVAKQKEKRTTNEMAAHVGKGNTLSEKAALALRTPAGRKLGAAKDMAVYEKIQKQNAVIKNRKAKGKK